MPLAEATKPAESAWSRIVLRKMQGRSSGLRWQEVPRGRGVTLIIAAVALSCVAVGSAHAEDLLSQQSFTRIRQAAMHSGYAHHELRTLAKGIGARLSGSPQAREAQRQIADSMRALGLQVSTLSVSVPHWVPGQASAALVEFPGQPEGQDPKIRNRDLVVAALGNSPSTPAEGLTAPVLVVHSFDELNRDAAKVRGRIVVFDTPFEQFLADNGYAPTAYARAVRYRLHGPARAAQLGAVAALVRSAAGGKSRVAHTGATIWPAGSRKIPSAGLATADADMIAELAAKGEVEVHLTLSSRNLAPETGADVIGDLPGTEHPEQFVIVSGHYDSWYLGEGAQDDACGVAVALGVAAVFQQLELHPRRTLRFVAWANEENGLSGAKGYAKAMAPALPQHVAAIENDMGAGRPLGIAAQIATPSASLLGVVFDALEPIGVTLLTRSHTPVAGDLAPLNQAGVPGFAPLVDTRRYFDLHHSAADTLDTIDPDNLRRQVALEAVLAWWLANADPLPRLPKPDGSGFASN